jgi:hypothetical protein
VSLFGSLVWSAEAFGGESSNETPKDSEVAPQVTPRGMSFGTSRLPRLQKLSKFLVSRP